MALGEAKWCCDAAPQDVTVEFEAAVSLTHFTVASSSDTPARDPRAWSISGSNDSASFTPIHSRDNDSIFSQGETTTYPPIDQPPFANPSPGSPSLYFRVEE